MIAYLHTYVYTIENNKTKDEQLDFKQKRNYYYKTIKCPFYLLNVNTKPNLKLNSSIKGFQ